VERREKIKSEALAYPYDVRVHNKKRTQNLSSLTAYLLYQSCQKYFVSVFSLLTS